MEPDWEFLHHVCPEGACCVWVNILVDKWSHMFGYMRVFDLGDGPVSVRGRGKHGLMVGLLERVAMQGYLEQGRRNEEVALGIEPRKSKVGPLQCVKE